MAGMRRHSDYDPSEPPAKRMRMNPVDDILNKLNFNGNIISIRDQFDNVGHIEINENTQKEKCSKKYLERIITTLKGTEDKEHNFLQKFKDIFNVRDGQNIFLVDGQNIMYKIANIVGIQKPNDGQASQIFNSIIQYFIENLIGENNDILIIYNSLTRIDDNIKGHFTIQHAEYSLLKIYNEYKHNEIGYSNVYMIGIQPYNNIENIRLDSSHMCQDEKSNEADDYLLVISYWIFILLRANPIIISLDNYSWWKNYTYNVPPFIEMRKYYIYNKIILPLVSAFKQYINPHGGSKKVRKTKIARKKLTKKKTQSKNRKRKTRKQKTRKQKSSKN